MIMRWPVTILVLCLFVQAEAKLCKRNGCYCKNNGVLLNEGCECSSGFHGYDCGLETQNLCPTNVCNNGGVCFDMGKCYCHGDYFGNECQYEKAPLNCGTDSMQVGFAIPKERAVRVYATANEACKFNRVAESFGHAIYMLEVNLTSTRSVPCMDVITETTIGDVTSYKIDGYVAEHPTLYTPKDWAMTFECNYTSIGTPTQRDVTAESSDILFAFTNATTGMLVDNIEAREPFDVVFFLRPNSTYRNLTLRNLVVYNQDHDVRMFTLIENGKSNYLARKWHLYRDQDPHNPSDVQEYFNFDVGRNETVPAVKVKVNGLNEKASIYVDYQVKVCLTPVCPQGQFGRKRDFFFLQGQGI